MGQNIRVTSGPAIERAGDLASLLTNLSSGDVLFIDEIHRLSHAVEEVLYPAMEDYALDIMIGKRPVGAQHPSRPAEIHAHRRDDARGFALRAAARPIRHHFPLTDVHNRRADADCAPLCGRLKHSGGRGRRARDCAPSRGTPRIVNRLLKRVRDYAQVRGDGVITKQMAQEALTLLDVDDLGLTVWTGRS